MFLALAPRQSLVLNSMHCVPFTNHLFSRPVVLQILERALRLDKYEEPDCGDLPDLYGYDNTNIRQITAWFTLAVGNHQKQQLLFESENFDQESDENVTASLTWLGQQRMRLWNITLTASTDFASRVRKVDEWDEVEWSKGGWEELRALSGFGAVDTRPIESFAKDVSGLVLRKLEEECGEEDGYGMPIGLKPSDFDHVFGLQPAQQQDQQDQDAQQRWITLRLKDTAVEVAAKGPKIEAGKGGAATAIVGKQQDDPGETSIAAAAAAAGKKTRSGARRRGKGSQKEQQVGSSSKKRTKRPGASRGKRAKKAVEEG